MLLSQKYRFSLTYPGIYPACLGSKNYWDSYNSDVMGKCMPSIWFKMSNCKIPHIKYCIFFRQPVPKIIGKPTIWTILCLSAFPLLITLRDSEQNWCEAMFWVQNIL